MQAPSRWPHPAELGREAVADQRGLDVAPHPRPGLGVPPVGDRTPARREREGQHDRAGQADAGRRPPGPRLGPPPRQPPRQHHRRDQGEAEISETPGCDDSREHADATSPDPLRFRDRRVETPQGRGQQQRGEGVDLHDPALARDRERERDPGPDDPQEGPVDPAAAQGRDDQADRPGHARAGDQGHPQPERADRQRRRQVQERDVAGDPGRVHDPEPSPGRGDLPGVEPEVGW